MALQLLPHQRFAFDWLQSRPRAVLSLEQRLGKTPVAILDIKGPTNVVCPSFLKQQWFDEISTWRPELRPRIIRAGQEPEPGGDIWIVNYEILQDCTLYPTPHLIVDEGHYAKSHEAKRALTVIALAEQAKRVRWLTGTVMPNRSMELWPVLRALKATELSAEAFGLKFAGGYQDQWGKWQFKNNTATPELRALIDPCILRMTREQVGMLPNEWRMISLDLPIDEREREYSLDEIARNDTPLALAGLADLLHFQGRAKVPEALAYITALHEQAEGPMLVFAWHRDIIDELCMRLTQRGLRTGCIVGDTHPDERTRLVKLFQGGGLDVLVGNRKAMGVGLPLHLAERVVFVEGAWNEAEMNQAADRGVSMERARSLRVDVLTVHRSIDEFMVRRCLEKQRAIDSIIQPSGDFQSWQKDKQPLHRPINRPATHPSRLWRAPFERCGIR